MFMEKSVNLFAIKALTIIYCLRRVIYFPETPYRRIALFSLLLFFAEGKHIAMKKQAMHTEKMIVFESLSCKK